MGAFILLFFSSPPGDDFMNLIEPIAANLPYMTCVGNHEHDMNFTHYRERFAMPNRESENMFYSFDMGPIHFVAFSTEVYYERGEYDYKMDSIQAQFHWLEEDLRKANENREERPWIIVYGHRPMYCSTDDPTYSDCCLPARAKYRDASAADKDFKDYVLEKLFYDHGVDLEFYGHEHSYERLLPLYNNTVDKGNDGNPYKNPKAPVHIITGSGGCSAGGDVFQKDVPVWNGFRTVDQGFSILTVHNFTHLFLEQLNTNNPKDAKVIDTMWLVKDNHGINV